jgi:hypothetical protein
MLHSKLVQKPSSIARPIAFGADRDAERDKQRMGVALPNIQQPVAGRLM